MLLNDIPKAYFDRQIPRRRDGFSSDSIRNNYLALASGDFLPMRAVSSLVVESHDFGTNAGAAAIYSGTGVTVTTNKINNTEGIACLQALVDATGNRQILRSNLDTVIDLSSFTKIGIWQRCNTTSSAFQFILRDNSSNESYWNITSNGTIDTWEQASLTLASPDANSGTPAVLTNIISYGYKGLDASITYLFDEITAYIWGMKVYVMQSYVGDYFYPFYESSDTRVKFDGGLTPTITAPVSNARIDLLSYNPNPGSAETYLTITQGSVLASPTYTNIPTLPAGHLPLYAIYIPTGATKIVEYHQQDVYSTDGYIFADLRPLYGSSGGSTKVRGTFTNANLSTGVLTITHNLGLSAPYTLKVTIFDNTGAEILGVDSVVGSANSIALTMTSFGTLSGTWGYEYSS